jgi:hypothetical protein
MRDSFTTINVMVKVDVISIINTNILENGQMINLTDLEH